MVVLMEPINSVILFSYHAKRVLREVENELFRKQQHPNEINHYCTNYYGQTDDMFSSVCPLSPHYNDDCPFHEYSSTYRHQSQTRDPMHVTCLPCLSHLN
jgi:hypothetical protein